MSEAERSNQKLATQLKGLYGELGTMLATKQKEMDGQSKFLKQPSPHQALEEEYAST